MAARSPIVVNNESSDQALQSFRDLCQEVTALADDGQNVSLVFDCEGSALGLPHGTIDMVQLSLLSRNLDFNGDLGPEDNDVFLVEVGQNKHGDTLDRITALFEHAGVTLFGWGLRADFAALKTLMRLDAKFVDLQAMLAPAHVDVTTEKRLESLSKYCQGNGIHSHMASKKRDTVAENYMKTLQAGEWHPSHWYPSTLSGDMLDYAADDISLIRTVATRMLPRFTASQWQHCMQRTLALKKRADLEFMVHIQMTYFDEYMAKWLLSQTPAEFAKKTYANQIPQRYGRLLEMSDLLRYLASKGTAVSSTINTLSSMHTTSLKFKRFLQRRGHTGAATQLDKYATAMRAEAVRRRII
ncbi:MAG: hypothetical protein MHM6MM_002745 [Cercozoa sp. M6MM]